MRSGPFVLMLDNNASDFQILKTCYKVFATVKGLGAALFEVCRCLHRVPGASFISHGMVKGFLH